MATNFKETALLQPALGPLQNHSAHLLSFHPSAALPTFSHFFEKTEVTWAVGRPPSAANLTNYLPASGLSIPLLPRSPVPPLGSRSRSSQVLSPLLHLSPSPLHCQLIPPSWVVVTSRETCSTLSHTEPTSKLSLSPTCPPVAATPLFFLWSQISVSTPHFSLPPQATPISFCLHPMLHGNCSNQHDSDVPVTKPSSQVLLVQPPPSCGTVSTPPPHWLPVTQPTHSSFHVTGCSSVSGASSTATAV